MIPEVARMVVSELELSFDSLRCNLDVVDNYQQKVFDRQLLEESKYNTSFVSDRSIIDCLAYSAQHSRILPKLLKSKELQDNIKTLQQKDTIIFLLKPSKNTLSQDGVREKLDWDGIISIDAQIKLLYEMFEIRYFQINTDSAQERIKLIDSVLSLL
jgi:predicted ATPase